MRTGGRGIWHLNGVAVKKFAALTIKGAINFRSKCITTNVSVLSPSCQRHQSPSIRKSTFLENEAEGKGCLTRSQWEGKVVIKKQLDGQSLLCTRSTI